MPDFSAAIIRAMETAMDFGTSPLDALKRQKNVLLMPYDISGEGISLPTENRSFTLVNRVGTQLQYIVVYNTKCSDQDLARELAHVMLQHDGSSPEAVWSAEADCFARCYLSMPKVKKIISKRVSFRPHHTTLWSLKSVREFDSIDHMKAEIVAEQNRISRFIGGTGNLTISHVTLEPSSDPVTGWQNVHSVIVAGRSVGYCGE